MNRKTFISSFLLSSLAIPISKSFGSITQEPKNKKKPAFLKPNSTIGITSPAGYITLKQIESSVKIMESWGFNIKIGNTIGKRDFTYGGTDRERLEDFQAMLDDPNIDAIMCARGGYGFVRIIDELNFKKFKKKPKWIIGFSDVTILHSHIQQNFGIATIHSKMCNSFPDNWNDADNIQKETILSIKNTLTGEPTILRGEPSVFNKFGTCSGELVGGNLSLLESLAGSKSDLNCDGKILFIEDTGEPLYKIDRMLWNLKRTGKLEKLSALLVGGFKMPNNDSVDDFGKSVHEIISERIMDYNYPVVYDFPVGHQKNNYALQCGVKHKLIVNENGFELNSL